MNADTEAVEARVDEKARPGPDQYPAPNARAGGA